jgi:hypothetical protein
MSTEEYQAQSERYVAIGAGRVLRTSLDLVADPNKRASRGTRVALAAVAAVLVGVLVSGASAPGKPPCTST